MHIPGLTRRLLDGFLQVWIPCGHVNAHSALTDAASVISNVKFGFKKVHKNYINKLLSSAPLQNIYLRF